MFSKRLLASITLDKKKLDKGIKESCIVECIPTINLLTKTEMDRLKYLLSEVSEILRRSYIRSKY